MASVKEDREHRRMAIQEIEEIPTISAIFKKLIDLLESEDCSAKELSDLISQDQSITSLILKLVNSAFYGHMREITSLHQAIVILGLNTVKSIALGASLFKSDSKRKDKYTLDKNQLWFHSLGTATTCKIIAKKIGYKDIEEAFAAGLLHDVGMVVFDAFFREEFKEVLLMASEKNLHILKAEKDILNISHDEAGQILLTKWKLPLAIASAIGGHHDIKKVEKKYQKLTCIVHLSNIIVKKLKIGSSGDKRIPQLNRNSAKVIGLSPKDVEQVMRETAENKEKIEAFELI